MRDLRRMIVRENRIYIMPTGGGFLFLSAIVVLILTASTYNNNLIFILAFFLFSVFVVSMLQTHYNLKGMRLQYIGSDEGFEGDKLVLTFYLQQKRARQKKALSVRTRSQRFRTVKNTIEDISPQDNLKATRIEISAWQRGIHPVPEMLLETRYPLGLFRAWKVFRPTGQLIVYPKPQGQQLLPPKPHDHGDAEMGFRSSPDGDFGELKNYLPGESYHQIAWKHYARTNHLYTKLHWGAEDRHYVIPWQPPQKDRENYLMQMSQWIKQAVEENASFEMHTSISNIQAGRGFEHGKTCWRALAMLPKEKGA